MKFKVGDKVILSGFEQIDGVSWNPSMGKLIGTITTIKSIYGTKIPAIEDGYNTLRDNYYQIDDGWTWAERAMKPAAYHPDQKCRECRTISPHGEPENGDYICDFCKALQDLEEPTAQQKYEKNWYAIFGRK